MPLTSLVQLLWINSWRSNRKQDQESNIRRVHRSSCCESPLGDPIANKIKNRTSGGCTVSVVVNQPLEIQSKTRSGIEHQGNVSTQLFSMIGATNRQVSSKKDAASSRTGWAPSNSVVQKKTYYQTSSCERTWWSMDVTLKQNCYEK